MSPSLTLGMTIASFNCFFFTHTNTCFSSSNFSQQTNDLLPWRTLGISPHGKYYRSLPRSPQADNTANKHLYRMCVNFPPVSSKATSSVGLLHFITTLGVRQRLPDGGGVTSAQISLHITLGQGKVLFLQSRKSTGILRPTLILIWTSSGSQNPSLGAARKRENLGALLLLLTRLALQLRVQ